MAGGEESYELKFKISAPYRSQIGCTDFEVVLRALMFSFWMMDGGKESYEFELQINSPHRSSMECIVFEPEVLVARHFKIL